MKARRPMGIRIVAAILGLGGCMTSGYTGPGGEGAGGAGGNGGVITQVGGQGGAPGQGGQGAASGGGGSCGEGVCCDPTDCAQPMRVCVGRTCVTGVCGETPMQAGDTSPWQTSGDCRTFVCNDTGGADVQPDSTDVLDDHNQCTDDVCYLSDPINVHRQPGSACADGGTYCNGAAQCVECTIDAHCPVGSCSPAGVCLPDGCDDGIQNNGETAVDCGGPCPGTCEVGAPCQVGADCIEGVCQGGLCAPPSCSDGVENGSETDVDCGGSCPDRCGPLEGCNGNSDCAGAQCSGTICVPNCQDGVENGAETDVDCGGPICGDCALGDDCHLAVDCASGFCADGKCCESACDGECVSCAEQDTGAADGTCAPIPQGEDPGGDCAQQPASTCGTTGACDGTGMCAKHAQGTICGPVATGSCTNGAATTADLCDGSGTCVHSSTTPCAPYACGATECATTCSTSADCAAGAYCMGNGCFPKKQNGEQCTTVDECQSGYCIDGTCCNTACGGGSTADCQACNVPGAMGTCEPVATGTVCRPANGSCDIQEVCDGAGTSCPADAFKPSGEACGSAQSCSNGVRTNQDTCNGSGTCNDSGTTSCSPYSCADQYSCRSSCSSHGECASGHYCNAPSCVPTLPNGSLCTAGYQCQSGLCNTYFRDADGDGYGSAGVTAKGCSTPPAGYVSNSSDCNDSSASIKPGGTEVCNSVDDDCDGSIDEGLCCDPLAGTHGQTWIMESAFSTYQYQSVWCCAGWACSPQCFQGTYYYSQSLAGQSCAAAGSGGSCYDPDATWLVTCNALIDCVYDCSGNCIPAGC